MGKLYTVVASFPVCAGPGWSEDHHEPSHGSRLQVLTTHLRSLRAVAAAAADSLTRSSGCRCQVVTVLLSRPARTQGPGPPVSNSIQAGWARPASAAAEAQCGPGLHGSGLPGRTQAPRAWPGCNGAAATTAGPAPAARFNV